MSFINSLYLIALKTNDMIVGSKSKQILSMRYRYILIDRVIIPILSALHVPPNFSTVDNATTTSMGQTSNPASGFTP